jgi:CspA family cold shock protein
MTGIIKWYSAIRGYGFIICDGEEYYFHRTGIVGYKKAVFPKIKEQVLFDIEINHKGRMAVNVIAAYV